MSTPAVPRRAVLQIGAAVVAYSLLSTTAHAEDAEDPPPSPALSQPAPTEPTSGTLTQGVWLWQRTEYGDGTTLASADPTKYTLAFLADGRFNIQADCNHGSGSYTVAGSQLTLRLGPMTLAACPPGSQDTVFLRDLQQVVTHVFDGENLVLNMRIDSGSMVFSPQPPVSLTGAPWWVLSVNNGRGAVVTVLPGTQLSAEFGEGGTVGGSTGCNAYRGLYAAADATIAFGPIVTTRRACPSPEAVEQEQAFLAALSASTRYELLGDRLKLRNEAGATQLDLVRPTG